MFAADTDLGRADDAEHNELGFAQTKPVDEVLDSAPVAGVCERIAEQQGFFHWELDFAPVFARGAGSTCRSATRRGCGRTGTTTSSSPRTTHGSGWPTSPPSLRRGSGGIRCWTKATCGTSTSAPRWRGRGALGLECRSAAAPRDPARPVPLLHGPHLAQHGQRRSGRTHTPRVALHRGLRGWAAAGDLPAAAATVAVPAIELKPVSRIGPHSSSTECRHLRSAPRQPPRFLDTRRRCTIQRRSTGRLRHDGSGLGAGC